MTPREPRAEGALEACAREINQLCADLTGLALDDDEKLVAIMRRHGLREKTALEREVDEIAEKLGPEGSRAFFRTTQEERP